MVIQLKWSEFGEPESDSKPIYISYKKIMLEHSHGIWNSSMIEQNSQDLTRVQKSAWRNKLCKDFSEKLSEHKF